MTYFTNKLFAKSAIFGLAAAAVMSTSAVAQDYGLAPATPVDLKEISCWDVVTLNEDDRASVMTMMYGYSIAQKGTSTISPEAVQVAIVLTMTDCVEKPDAKVHQILSEKMDR